MNVLVTGGAGFIGSNLVDFLVGNNHITVIDNLSSGKITNINKRADFHKFNNPEDFYYLKKVRVKGILKKFNGRPEIIIKTPDQLEIVK